MREGVYAKDIWRIGRMQELRKKKGISMRKRKLGFTGLEHRVQAEYERKGYSERRAEYIGEAVAGKIAGEKRRVR